MNAVKYISLFISLTFSAIALAEEPPKSESLKPNITEKTDAVDANKQIDQPKATPEKPVIPPDSEWVHPTK